MTSVNFLYLVFGMSIMFFGTMSFLFWHGRKEGFKFIAFAVTGVICVQLIKDLFLVDNIYSDVLYINKIVSLYDSFIMPAYFFMLYELCRPGRVRLRTVILLEVPFVILASLYTFTRWDILFYIVVAISVIVGFYSAISTFVEIPKYNILLKQQYSYQKNIDLSWLRAIMISFFIILTFWLFCCNYIGIYSDISYLLMNLVMWIFVCYFLSRHEAAIDITSLALEKTDDFETNTFRNGIFAVLSEKVYSVFEEDQVFLNPKLNLSDHARDLGTNRSYLSRYFNNEENKSFFDYVNGYRLRYAESLLSNIEKTIEVIFEESGFNSVSTFRRVFQSVYGCSPSKFRTKFNRIT